MSGYQGPELWEGKKLIRVSEADARAGGGGRGGVGKGLKRKGGGGMKMLLHIMMVLAGQLYTNQNTELYA